MKLPETHKRITKRQTSPCKITPRNASSEDISPVSGYKTSLLKKNKIVSNNMSSINNKLEENKSGNVRRSSKNE